MRADATACSWGRSCAGPTSRTLRIWAWAVQERLRVGHLLHMPFYHPVVEEGIRSALRRLCTNLGERMPERPEDLECGPGA